MSPATQRVLDILAPKGNSFSRKEIIAVMKECGLTWSAVKPIVNDLNKVGHGQYSITRLLGKTSNPESTASVTDQTMVKTPAPAKLEPLPKFRPQARVQFSTGVESVLNESSYIPQTDSTFIKWGYYTDVVRIVMSGLFFPTYIAGHTGNGKTLMIEQACAQLKRELVRVQISPETDEDDLIGGFRLIDGQTVFQKGPVIKAMESGAILLIDEIDRATNKIMCLQGIVEGKPVLIKKTGDVITPTPGFNIFATANTNGKGSDDGRYAAAGILDEAFLERFVITMEQPYPTPAIEKRILEGHMAKYDVVDDEFANKLIDWAYAIRKTFFDNAIDELVSTRRLCHIIATYSIFNDRMKAIELCINRFDVPTRTAFLDLYTKVDSSVSLSAKSE
jgi:hypothetical protein